MDASPGCPHVVIIGCGFGGLEAAQTLRKANVCITLIDRANHHLFQPLLYQVATAGLSAPAIAAPIRHLFRRQVNVTTLLGDVVAIDPQAQTVTLHSPGTADTLISFDHLIVAAGATHSYFGNDQWAPFAPGLKTLADAMALRKRILFAFEAAEHESDPALREALLTFVVIGAGPTGVEMAGTMAEIARHTLPGEFRRINPAHAKVVLVEGGPRVLRALPPELSAKARLQLDKLGVQVLVGCRVTNITADAVTFKQGEDAASPTQTIACKTMVWAAGVAASPLGHQLAQVTACELDRAGRVVVDLALPWGRPLRFGGYVAWLFWLFAHIYFLIGFRNRVVVLLDWASAYLTFARHARIVVGGASLAPDAKDV